MRSDLGHLLRQITGLTVQPLKAAAARQRPCAGTREQSRPGWQSYGFFSKINRKVTVLEMLRSLKPEWS